MLHVLFHLIPVLAPGGKNYCGITGRNGGVNRVRDAHIPPLCGGQLGVWPSPGHRALSPYRAGEAKARKRAGFPGVTQGEASNRAWAQTPKAPSRQGPLHSSDRPPTYLPPHSSGQVRVPLLPGGSQDRCSLPSWAAFSTNRVI